jgi:hypothetical protein
VGIVTTLAVAAVALLSARAAIRAQYVIMGAIALSLLSLLFGSPLEGFDPTTVAPVESPENFWIVFAVFFPAVTGIMAGVNLSGDLARPEKSIPKGTLYAVGAGYLIYMVVPFILVGRADPATLIEDPLLMRRISFWGDAILLGVWGATLSSAVGSIMGAPRVLQALARDGVLPAPLQWLGRGSGDDDSPRAGTLFTLGLALIAVWYGDLNLIAPVLTMFFLTTYGVLNVTAGVERFLGSPSFRPTFRVHWAFSLLGAIGCVWVMMLINATATGIAAVFVVAIFVWLERRGLEATWGDVRRGIWMALTRAGLLRLRPESDARNWRPHLLVLSGAPTNRWHLIELASSLTQNRGLFTVATVVPRDQVSAGRRQGLEGSIREYLAARGIQALVRVVPGEDPFDGGERLVEAYGLGALVPNTVLLGSSDRAEVRPRYAQMITRFYGAQRNVIMVREGPEPSERRGRIDVWWGGLQGNGALMMILAYLLQTSLSWRQASVRLKMVMPNENARDDAMANIGPVVERLRTGAELEVIVSEGREFSQILRDSSSDADLVLLGMRAPEEGADYGEYLEGLDHLTEGLPTTVFVLAAEEIAFREILERKAEDA